MPYIKLSEGKSHPIRVNDYPVLAAFWPIADADTGDMVAVAIIHAGQRWDIPLEWIESTCYESEE